MGVTDVWSPFNFLANNSLVEVPIYEAGKYAVGAIDNWANNVDYTSGTREPRGQNINEAARMAMGAETRNINRLLTSSLQSRDVALANTGMFTSGERIQQGDVLRGAASRDLSDALARIGLQRETALQDYQFRSTDQSLRIQQMEEQARMARYMLIASIIGSTAEGASSLAMAAA